MSVTPMRSLISITIVLTLLFPVVALGREAVEGASGQAEFKALIGSELSNSELSEITGQGLGVPFIQAERESAKIILWDETKCAVTNINLFTGYGNSQRNTLSIQR